jgi:NADPH:quinone reductase
MRAIRIAEPGGTEVLCYEETPTPEPGAGEARIKIEAIGVNYIDIYHRTGQYAGKRPFTPGMEGAGVVDAVGASVTDLKVGDRVAYAMQQGAYADYAVIPAWKLVPVPSNISTEIAAAAMLQGMTAHYLCYSTYPIKAGDSALVHAAAGGLGLLVVQLAKQLGARVIGTVSTEEKARLAQQAGADEVILYTQVDFEQEVKRLTDGKGVNVVYDSVGKTTFDKSLNCLKPRGYLVLCGPQCQRLAVSHAAYARTLRCRPCGASVARGRCVQSDRCGQTPRRHRQNVSACRGGGSTPIP